MSNQEKEKSKNNKQAEETVAASQEAAIEKNADTKAAAKHLNEAEMLADAQKLAEDLTNEKDQLYKNHLRLQADFDNFRKRSRQERTDIVNMANSALILALLPVLDNFERAINALPADSGREGVQLIQRQLLETLAAVGLTPIEALGADFDPQIHEAVLQSEAEPEQKGKVLGEAQKGYMLNGKLLRASMVQVGA
ncbi:MAG: nucleotide exchange factor GrpE [Firmicutes bacterium]|nr:nucleotide exchange factor GrpE [Bacillota bacterium]